MREIPRFAVTFFFVYSTVSELNLLNTVILRKRTVKHWHFELSTSIVLH